MYLIAQYYLCKTNAMSSAYMLSLNRIPQNSSLLLRKSKNIHRLYPLNQNSRFSFFSNPSCHYLFWIQRFVQTFKCFLFYLIYNDIDFFFFYILNSSQKIWFNFLYICCFILFIISIFSLSYISYIMYQLFIHILIYIFYQDIIFFHTYLVLYHLS